MTLPVVNRTGMKPGTPRFDCLIEEANREAEAVFVYNPSRRATAFIEVAHYGRGTYVARVKSTEPGGLHLRLATVFSSPLER